MNPPPAEGLASRLLLVPALRTQPDRRLVTLVRDGYDAAFEEIVRRYGVRLRRYAAAIVGSRSEDVTQDAFSKALLALRRRDSSAGATADLELRPWLYRIVRNTALNDLRDRPPDPVELVESAAGGGRSAAEEAERREEMAHLVERLRALPEPQRAAIVMRELEGLGHGEIAAALGMSGGAARQAIFRARQALRDGVGLMIPMPALRMLVDHAADAGAAAGAGGAVAAVSGAGAGTALKVGVLTAVLAGSVGTGLAIKDDRPDNGGPERAAAAPSGRGAAAVEHRGRGSGSGASASGPGPYGSGDRGGGHGKGSDDIEHGGSGPESGRDDTSTGDQSDGGGSGGGGPGPGGRSGPGDGTGGSGGSGSSGGSGQSGGSGSSGPGPSGVSGGGSGPGPSGEDHSGPGGGGDGSSGPGGGTDDGISGDGALTEGTLSPEGTLIPDGETSGSDGGSGDSTTSNSGPGSLSDGGSGGGSSGPG